VADYTNVNLKEDVEDMAPQFGMPPGMEAHFATGNLQLQKSGASYMRLEPNFRVPFGHAHQEQEELYVLVSGSARVKVDDDVVDLGRLGALRIPPKAMRCVQAGPEGAEYLAFGAPPVEGDRRAESQLTPNWWSD
jgi:mannose-6-phosphate isomerase-like protein (cupin superfamily)